MAEQNSYEYSSKILTSATPSSAVEVIRSRLNKAKVANDVIATFFEQYRRINETYNKEIGKLYNQYQNLESLVDNTAKHVPQAQTNGTVNGDVNNELGTVDSLWSSVISALVSEKRVRDRYLFKVARDVEQVIGTYSKVDPTWNEMRDLHQKLKHHSRDLAENESKIGKIERKHKEHGRNLRDVESDLTKVQSAWNNEAPYVFDSFERTDLNRLTSLKEALYQFMRFSVDSTEEILKIEEKTIDSILSYEPSEELKRFADTTAKHLEEARVAALQSSTSRRFSLIPGSNSNMIPDSIQRSSSQKSDSLPSPSRRLSGRSSGPSNSLSANIGQHTPSDSISFENSGFTEKHSTSKLRSKVGSIFGRKKKDKPKQTNMDAIHESTPLPSTSGESGLRSSPKRENQSSTPVRVPSKRYARAPIAYPNGGPQVRNTSEESLESSLEPPTENRNDTYHSNNPFPVPSTQSINQEQPAVQLQSQKLPILQQQQLAGQPQSQILSHPPSHPSLQPSLHPPTDPQNQPNKVAPPPPPPSRKGHLGLDNQGNRFDNEVEASPGLSDVLNNRTPSLQHNVIREEVDGDDDEVISSIASTAFKLQPAVSTRRSNGRGRRDRRDIQSTLFTDLAPANAGTPAESNKILPSIQTQPAHQQTSSTITSPISVQSSSLSIQSSYNPETFVRPGPSNFHSYEDASSMKSGKSSHSSMIGTGSGGLFQHPDINIPGFSISICEVYNTVYRNGYPQRSQVLGEVAFTYNPENVMEEDVPLSIPIKLPNFNAVSKLIPNPSFVKPGSTSDEFNVLVSSINSKTIGGLKYVINDAVAPIIVLPIWRFEETQASLMLTLRLNPEFQRQVLEPLYPDVDANDLSLTFSELTFYIGIVGTSTTSAMSKPQGAFNKEKNRLIWNFSSSNLPNSDSPFKLFANKEEKLICRFITTSRAREADVGVVTKFKTGALHLGGGNSGKYVSFLYKDASSGDSDPFSSSKNGSSESFEWVPVPGVRTLVSGSYAGHS